MLGAAVVETQGFLAEPQELAGVLWMVHRLQILALHLPAKWPWPRCCKSFGILWETVKNADCHGTDVLSQTLRGGAKNLGLKLFQVTVQVAAAWARS